MAKRLFGLWLLLSAAAIVTAGADAADKQSSSKKSKNKIDFNRDIRPILSDHCYACHGFDKNKRKAGLRLDTEEGTHEELNSGGFLIVPKSPDKSVLYQRIMSKDSEEQMPPPTSHKQLNAAQKETIKKWIAEGAEWKPHWTFVPVERPEVPKAKDKKWALNPVDNFILARLEQEKLKPAKEADRITLIRRLTLDLTGLPPTPKEVHDFVADKSDEAYEKVVDRLLSAPTYGERMALHWLDLVRFADSAGYHSDNERNVGAYRDYVIDAFNNNLRFDQFTREQLAGDLLPNATRQQKVASAYNRLLMTTEEGGAQPKEYAAKYMADRVRNLSSVWMGATLGCAECHDHKFDPYSMKDFYSLASFFADIQENPVGRREPGMPLPTPEQEAEMKVYDDAIVPLRKTLDTPTPTLEAAQAEWEKAVKSRELQWTVLKPTEAKSKVGATMTINDDGSILVGGATADPEVHTLTFKADLKKITGFRLEVLPHDSLPSKGPGRVGNFVLSDFDLNIAGKGQKFTAATATFSQNGWDAAGAIDKQNHTGWAIADKFGVANHALFELEKDVGGEGETTLQFVLSYHYGSNHQLGHYRLSATTDQRPIRVSGGLPKEIGGILDLDVEKRTPEQKNRIAAYFRENIAQELQPVRAQIEELNKKKGQLNQQIRLCIVSVKTEPRMIRVLPRGNWMDDSGEVVSPAVPHFLRQIPAKDGQRATRLDLAEWLVAPDNPMTARTFVNRAWKMFFGTGISKALDDLGAQGEWPTHPELLDWLASEFSSGWDVKALVKLLVMSNTYRQSSIAKPEVKEKDPYNRFYARQSRFRLDAEFVRDNALAVSGLLVQKFGGNSVKPYQPAGYWSHMNFPTREWQNDKGESIYRRGLYTWWQRTFPHPSMIAFDAPSREECCAERTRSNTPQQSLVLLNDPTYVEAARVFAARAMKEGGSGAEDRIAWAFEMAVSRKPQKHEAALLAELYARHFEQFNADTKAAEALLKVGDAPAPPDANKAELAALTSVTRAILNLHETITRY